jgi:dCMP deaminase
MADQKNLDRAYLRMAYEWGTLSHSERARVGSLVVSGDMIISDGFNGTPSGFPNACEDQDGKTLPEVLHAEANALMKLARSTQSSGGATVYSVLSPCFDCAKLMVQSGISRVVYSEVYRDQSGLDLLAKAGIPTVRMEVCSALNPTPTHLSPPEPVRTFGGGKRRPTASSS